MQRNLWKTVFLSLWSVFLTLCGMGGIVFSVQMHRWNPKESPFTIWLFLGLGLLYLFYGTFTLGEIVGPIITERRIKNFRFLAQRLSALYEKLREQVAAEWKELEPKIVEGQALMTKHDEIVAQYQKLGPAIESLTEYLENINKEYQAKFLEKAKIEKVLEEYIKRNQTESAQIDVLKKEFAEKQDRSNNLQAEQNGLKLRLVQIQDDYKILSEEHEKADKTFSEFKKKKEEIITQNESLKSEIKNLVETIAKEPDPEQLRMELVSLQEKCVDLEAKKSQLLIKVEPLKTENAKLNEYLTIINNENISLEKEIGNQEREIERLTRQKEENERLISGISAKTAKLQRETKEMETAREKLMQEIQLKESENMAGREELESIRQQLDQKRCERDKNQSEIRSLEDELQALAKKLQDETRQLKELRQDNETDRKKLAKLANEKNNLTEEKTILLKDINEAEKERKVWQQERVELKTKYHSYKSFMESREKELNEPQIKRLVSQAMEALVRLEG